MRVVGLTGGIACGKSTVSTLLSQSGIPVVDCDKIAHKLLRKGRWSWRRVVSAFGQEILLPSGEVDRERLGRLVFSSKALRQRLNRATHLPLALCILWELLWHWLTLHTLVVVDMPLLFETGAKRLSRPVVVVSCTPEIQVQRLMARDGCGLEDAQAKISSQMPLDLKTQMADVVLDNSGSSADLLQQVQRLVVRLKAGTLTWGLLLSPVACLAAGGAFAGFCLSAAKK